MPSAASTSAASATASELLRTTPPRDLLAATLRLYADLSSAYFQALGPVSSSSAIITPTIPPLLEPHLSRIHLFRLLPTSASGSSHGHPRPSSSELLSLISSLDEFLAGLLESVARVHASNQARIEQLAQTARELEEGVTKRTREIKALKANLDGLVREGEKERRAAARAEKAPINVDHLLSYADLLSRTTSAPPGYVPPEAAAELAQAATAAATNGPGAGQGAEKDSVGAPPADLPFPDEALMARSAIWGAAPRWADFKDIAQGGGGDGEAQGGEAAGQARSGDRNATQHRAPAHQQMAAYDESDAFDLDLN